MKIIIRDCCCGPKKRRIRLIPGFGPVLEQKRPLPPVVPPQVPSPPRFFCERPRLMATLQMTDTQQCTFTVSATDERGNPVPLPAGTIEWLTDNTDLLNLVPSADVVGLYSCGPTVYSYQHLGNMRPYVFEIGRAHV